MTFTSAIALAAVGPSATPSPTGGVTAPAAPTLATPYLLFIVIAISLVTWWVIHTRNGRYPHGPGGQD